VSGLAVSFYLSTDDSDKIHNLVLVSYFAFYLHLKISCRSVSSYNNYIHPLSWFNLHVDSISLSNVNPVDPDNNPIYGIRKEVNRDCKQTSPIL